MTWALVLILHFGTPQAHEVTVTHRLPSWEACMLRAVHEIKLRRNQSAFRCEPSLGQDVRF